MAALRVPAPGSCAGSRAVGQSQAGAARREPRLPRRWLDGAHVALVGLGDGADDGQAQPGSTLVPAPSGVGAMKALEDPLALGGGDPGTVVDDHEPDPIRSVGVHLEPDEALALGGVVDRVGGQVAEGLSQPVRIGSQRSRGDRTEFEMPVGGQADPVPQLAHEAVEIDALGTQEVRVLGLGQEQEIVNETADARDLAVHVLLGAPDVVGGGVLLGRQHLELPPDHRDRGPQLVRGIGDELPLSLELAGEAVEHVVEGVGQHAHLPAAIPGVHPRLEFAGVDPGGDRRHAAQGRRDPSPGQVGGDEGQGQGQGSGQDEGPRHPVLGPAHDGQWLSGPDHHLPAPDADRPFEDPCGSDVRHLAHHVAELGPPAARRPGLLGAGPSATRRPPAAAGCPTISGWLKAARAPGTRTKSSVEVAP